MSKYVVGFKKGLKGASSNLVNMNIKDGLNNPRDENGIIMICIKKAYDDLKRTCKGINPESKVKFFSYLAYEISKYFINKKNDFNSWHKQLCDKFIEVI